MIERKASTSGGTCFQCSRTRPQTAIIPFEEYESMLETLDILETEPGIVKKLKKAQEEIKAGDFVKWNKVKRKS